MKLQKGFTLIELMVVIVIIGILSALAIPKMFGVSSKAKVAEAPGVIANWETLQSAYAQETGAAGTETQIGFKNPGATSKWFTYASSGGDLIMTALVTPNDIGTCVLNSSLISTFVVATDAYTHSGTAVCRTMVPNF